MNQNVRSNKEFSRGDIFMMNPNPTKGHEQGNYRPFIVLSEELQKFSPHMLQVAPITSQRKGYPLHVELQTLNHNVGGLVLTEHTRTIDVMAYSVSFKVIDEATTECILECKKIIDSF
ncbi:type II toxin-antitoxin system PemK/MazF family toxin [Vagococcus hydrophili]|uniref:Type II toxin-antitoxin system PemK/MazF family toxin n=1 Tax=Vagococcus hydrophili TaxID=2714947 RepID=A0A6G8AU40_9ENTE|nr:type II toxin-antitoxin system PemK/MazF family toxin [Vagococcus hydrophili]QIL48500.1 type II toxin-antitoxin system PemK/MazF family toxin [Vagococcus hydrophili]